MSVSFTGTNPNENRKMREREFSIDVLKFLAALLITWSHFEKPLGDYSVLATGGAFGDSLFFFISGYTLLLSNRRNSFISWYKRRINRIYPTIFAWALLTSIFLNSSSDMLDTVLYGGGFFVTCIMVFYLLFYPVKKHFSNYMGEVVLFCFLTQGVVYFLIDHLDFQQNYCWSWSSYFIVMLIGAMLGRKRKENEPIMTLRAKSICIVFGLLGSSILYYLMMYIERSYPFVAIFNIIPLIGFTYFMYTLCQQELLKRLYNNQAAHSLIMTIGGMCLEIYIVQPVLLTNHFNHLFPLNLLLMFILIFVVAFVLKCLSRLWAQTFKEDDYNWKEIVKLY